MTKENLAYFTNDDSAAAAESLLTRIVAFAAESSIQPDPGESGWYVNTEEGSAIAAGAKDLSKIDVDSVLADLGQRIALVNKAVQAGAYDEGNHLQRPQLSQESSASDL